jgi:ribosomal protein S18 acetylase RimI-like enzyme
VDKDIFSVEDARQLMHELFGGAFDPPLDEATLRETLAQPNYHLFSHQQDGRTVAMASLYTVQLLSRRLAVIEEVVTLEPYRNQGIGSSLVRQAIEQALKDGATSIELTVREDRPDVIRFYESLGFRDRNQRAMRLCVAAK